MMKIMKGAFYVLKIIRSQLYQLVVDKAVFLILLIYILMDIHSLMELLSEISLSGETVSGGKAFALWSSATDVIIMLMTALIMVKDQSDKTINYEILSGKSRASVFFGRYVTAFGLCALMAVIEVWSVPIAFTVKNGWGSELKFSEALIRTLLILMFVFRVSAETAMFSVLFKKRKALVFFAYLPVIAFDSMLAGWLTSVVEMSDSPKKVLDWMSLLMIVLCDDVTGFELTNVLGSDGKAALRYTGIPGHMGILLFSGLGLGVLFLMLGYMIFRKRDME